MCGPKRSPRTRGYLHTRRTPMCCGTVSMGGMNVRPIAFFAAVFTAAVLALALTAGAQQIPAQTAQPKRPLPPTPATRYTTQRDTLNQNTVTVISGNPNGTYL